MQPLLYLCGLLTSKSPDNVRLPSAKTGKGLAENLGIVRQKNGFPK
jgi:hypothetical protein